MPSASASSPLTKSNIYYSAPSFDNTTSALPPIDQDGNNNNKRRHPNTSRNSQQQQNKRVFSVFGETPKSSRLVVERLRHDKTKDISQIVAAGDIYHKGRAKPTTPRNNRRNHIDNQFDIKDKKSMRDELLPDAEFVKRIFYTMANRQGGAIDSAQFEESAVVVFGRVNGIDLDEIPLPARDAHGLLMERIPNQKKMTLENFHVALVAAGYFMLMKPLFTIRKFATAKEFEYLAKNLGIQDAGNALKELDPKDTGKFSLRDFVWWAANRTCEGEFVLDLLPMKALSVSSPRTASNKQKEQQQQDATTLAGRCAVSPRLADILSEKEKLRNQQQQHILGNTRKNINGVNNDNINDDDEEDFQLENNNNRLPSIHTKNSSVSPHHPKSNNPNNAGVLNTPRETSSATDSLASTPNTSSTTTGRNHHRRVVARRNNNNAGVGARKPNQRQGNNEDDGGVEDYDPFEDVPTNDDEAKVRQAMKESIKDSETSTTPSNNNNLIDHPAPSDLQESSTNQYVPSPPKNNQQQQRRLPRRRGGGGGQVRTYPNSKQQNEENEDDSHGQTQPVNPSTSRDADQKFATSDSVFNESQQQNQNQEKEEEVETEPNQVHAIENETEEEQVVIVEEENIVYPSSQILDNTNNTNRQPRNIKEFGVISTKKSIHGNKLIVKKDGNNNNGAHENAETQQQNVAPANTIKRTTSNVSASTTGTTSVANSNNTNTISNTPSFTSRQQNQQKPKPKKTVQVQHHHQPTTGRYKKKGKLQEIL